jgi:hypothetical protein
LSLDCVRWLVAVLLLFGVFLAGSVDAVACEPLFEEASHMASAAHETGGKDSAPSTEKHGLCAHGHCHHGGQLVQADADVTTVLPATSEYRPDFAGPLHASPHDSLKRPPRA